MIYQWLVRTIGHDCSGFITRRNVWQLFFMSLVNTKITIRVCVIQVFSKTVQSGINSRPPSASSSQPAALSKQPLADSRRPTVNSRQPAVNQRRPSVANKCQQMPASSQQPVANSPMRHSSLQRRRPACSAISHHQPVRQSAT